MDFSPEYDVSSASRFSGAGDDHSSVRSHAAIFCLMYCCQSSDGDKASLLGRPDKSMSALPFTAPAAATERRNFRLGKTCAAMDCTVRKYVVGFRGNHVTWAWTSRHDFVSFLSVKSNTSEILYTSSMPPPRTPVPARPGSAGS